MKILLHLFKVHSAGKMPSDNSKEIFIEPKCFYMTVTHIQCNCNAAHCVDILLHLCCPMLCRFYFEQYGITIFFPLPWFFTGHTFYFASPDAAFAAEYAAFAVLPVLLLSGPTDPMTFVSYWLGYMHHLLAAVAADYSVHYYLHFFGKDLMLTPHS
jgi:hypothetical protein